MSGQRHAHGHCTCASHSARPWDRPEHWTAAEVAYLEGSYGRRPDAAIARHLGRSALGVRLKAKRLGLHKRDIGFSAREVAAIFGVDDTTVSKVWIRRYGVLRSSRPFRQGPHPIHIVAEAEVLRLIREHPEWIDVDRMPESPYRDLAVAGGRWLPLPEVQRLTGRHAHVLANECVSGRWPTRKRGVRWMVHESTIPAITATAGYAGRYASDEVREETLRHRRDRRKGIERPRPHPMLGRPPARTTNPRWRVEDCEPCDACAGIGRILRRGEETRPLPEGWAA